MFTIPTVALSLEPLERFLFCFSLPLQATIFFLQTHCTEKPVNFLPVWRSFLPLLVFCIHSGSLLLLFSFTYSLVQSVSPYRSFFKFLIILIALFWTCSNWWMLLKCRTCFSSWYLTDTEPSEGILLRVIVNYSSVCTLKWYLPLLLYHYLAISYYWCV